MQGRLIYCTNIRKFSIMSNINLSLANLIDERNELIKQRNELTIKLKYLDGLIERLGGNSIVEKEKSTTNLPSHTSKDPNYDPKKSMKTKVLYVLSKIGRFAHSTEIRDKMAELEGVSAENIKVSATLSAMRRAEKLHKHTVGNQNRNSFWGSTKWINEEGKILEGREFNPRMLTNSDEQSGLFDDF